MIGRWWSGQFAKLLEQSEKREIAARRSLGVLLEESWVEVMQDIDDHQEAIVP